MERLQDTPERLDGALGDAHALAGNLRDLRRINRLLGGVELSRWGVRRLSGGARGELRLIDVGTGAADIPVALIADAHRAGVRLHVVAVDSRAEVLAAARAVRPTLDLVPGLYLEQVAEDALPYPDGAFDIAHASLVVHHLEPDAAVRFLAELARVARRGIVVNDVQRGRLAWAGAWALTRLLTRNAWTRHDAPLSVRRAYTLPELRGLLARAGLEPVAERVGLLGHRFAVCARRAAAVGGSA